MNYDDALNYIHSLLVFGSQPGLERITELLCKLGNPQDELKYIHVAGTNGKGSACNMLCEVYKKAGLKVGLYTSPYIVDFRERIQINGEYIPKKDLCRLCEQIKDTDVFVTEFEFITALAFLWFKEQNCDIVILEVGLGGRFDATNVIKKPLCSVIMKIDFDHTAILGNTISEITMEKCGIIKGGSKVISYPLQYKEALDEIKNHSESLLLPDTSELSVISTSIEGNTFIYKGEKYKTRLVGRHQVYNAVTVIETVNSAGIPVSKSQLIDGLASAVVPARLELMSIKPLVLLDGAHNPNGADALSSFMENYNGQIVAVVGMMADKNCEAVLKKVLKYCSGVITVTVNENPRTISAGDLADIAKKYCDDVVTARDYDNAITLASEKSKGENPIFVFGSLYLASAIREKLKNFYNS